MDYFFLQSIDYISYIMDYSTVHILQCMEQTILTCMDYIILQCMDYVI